MPDSPIDFPALDATTGEVPWPALRSAIDALVAQPDLWPSIAEKFPDVEAETADDKLYFLYVPYILGMAAARLPDPHQSAITAWLVECLEKALTVDWDFSIEVINAALEVIGAPAIEPLMASIDRVPSTELFPLTQWFLAADIAATLPENHPARQKLAAKIMPLLRNPADWPGDEDLIAHVAARLQIPEARPLIKDLLKIPELDSIDRREIEASLKSFDTPDEILSPEDKVSELADRVEKFHKMASKSSDDESDNNTDQNADDDFDDDFDELPAESFDDATVRQAVDQLITNLGINPTPAAALPEEPEIPEPYLRTDAKVGRNDPCPCGSGKKYKKCHGK